MTGAALLLLTACGPGDSVADGEVPDGRVDAAASIEIALVHALFKPSVGAAPQPIGAGLGRCRPDQRR